MQVHVAIPHYNAPRALRNILAQLTEQDFDSITVLDDHSAGQQKLQDLARKFPTVNFIFGEKNIGAGANRICIKLAWCGSLIVICVLRQ